MAKADDKLLPPFANGYWGWDDVNNGLIFISREEQPQGLGNIVPGHQAAANIFTNIRFKDTVDNLEQAQFRRNYQRRIKPYEPQIVMLQDIKDVAFFTAERSDLTPEFMKFMHSEKMDEFLRALIIYFQYYFHVWDNLVLRREEAKRKLRQPIVDELENIVRDDLADLRSMLARNYGYIILGLGDSQRFYHMSHRNNVSLSDKDRHLYECVLCMAAKIVWIALLRKNFTLIEIELNRMFRTPIFNIMARLRTSAFQTNAEEDRVLLGAAHTIESKLKHHSPAVQELIYDNHSYKMLAIGQLRVEPVEERVAYLEAAYTAPEELLFDIQIGVGILGLAKSFLTPILTPKEGMAKRIKLPPFKLPPKGKIIDKDVTETLPKTPPQYTETELTINTRKTQSKLWQRYVAGVKHDENENLSVNVESNSESASGLSPQVDGGEEV